jgi:predicted amidohydrolase
MKIRIALAQMPIQKHCAATNLATAESYIKQAKRQRAQLVALPEDFVLGPLAGRVELADGKGQYRQAMQAMAKTYGIDLIAGSIIEQTKHGLKNRAYYFDAQGRQLACYEKVNLWLTERTYIKAGTQAVVAKTRFGKIGLTICWDLVFPELFRQLVRKGAEIVVCPAFWRYGDAGDGLQYDRLAEVHFVNACTTARAFENEMIVCFVNGSNEADKMIHTDKLIGRSQISMPFRGSVARLDHDRGGLLVYTVDTSILKTAEASYQIRGDLKRRVR